MTTTIPATLADALELYAQSEAVLSQPRKLPNLETTLKKYILPGLGFSPQALVKIDKCYAKQPLRDFVEKAAFGFAQALNQGLFSHKSKRTITVYRSNLTQFLKWMELQDWYIEVIQPTAIPNCAPKMRAKISLAQLHKGRKHAGAVPYGLKESELTKQLRSQINSFHTYVTSEWIRTAKGDIPLNETSWEGCYDHVLWFLGWLKNIKEFSLAKLDISLMINTSTLNEYLNWHLTEKGNGYSQASRVAITALNIAKWKYDSFSERTDFSDCEQVLKIRDILRRISLKEKTDRRTSSPEALEEKLLEPSQCEEIVEYLRSCCAERESGGRQRKIHAIIDSWQDYLIAAILVFSPVRQREIRELMIGKNLRREPDGWWVKLSPDGHKTGSKTGKSREYPLFPCHLKERLTKDLDEYVKKWRQMAELKHDYLFFRPGSNANKAVRGEPIPNSNFLSGSIPKLFLRISALLYGVENAKSPSPHDFRRMCATWVCKYGSPEEIVIYAELMGHSPQTLMETYQQCQSRDKTEKAESAFQKIREREKQIKAQKPKKIDFDEVS